MCAFLPPKSFLFLGSCFTRRQKTGSFCFFLLVGKIALRLQSPGLLISDKQGTCVMWGSNQGYLVGQLGKLSPVNTEGNRAGVEPQLLHRLAL